MAQACPICRAEVTASPRYPRYVCQDCARRAQDAAGAAVAFFNESMSGGCVGAYVASGAAYPSDECFVDGVRCRAREAYMGGIVLLPVD